jgi:iron complex outermembrane receptor protein
VEKTHFLYRCLFYDINTSRLWEFSIMHKVRTLTLGLIISATLPTYVRAEPSQEPAELEMITVLGEKLSELSNQSGKINEEEINALKSSTSDTAQLLNNISGISHYGAGGVSSLPVIHGLADDRLRIKVDGMDLISGCANHMNSPLSYINPTRVGTIGVHAGISPVSTGGDSIGGTIVVESTAPEFADPPDEILTKGELGAFYRSNGDARGANISTTLATEHLSINYSGSTTKANNYHAGDAFKAAGLAASDRDLLNGDEVGSTAYEATNHALDIALHQDKHLLELKLGYQNIPYQGWPNQRMDMTKNTSNQINLIYKGEFDWGNIKANLYRENTHHKMQFGDDKQFLYGDAPGMPMETEGHNTGLSLKTEIILLERDLIRVGTDLQRYQLDDYWEASGTGMMGPNTFLNINNGERDRNAVFTEWEANWNPRWMTLAGIRYENVRMDSGDVQGYNTMATYRTDATAFNNTDHSQTDDNFDLTMLAKFTPSETQVYEFGYAQKTRSPNLYERYSWSTGGMVMRMVNLVGDGNGYVGNLELSPEVAHTISATVDWHDAKQENWNLTITPHLSYVDDFIDAERISNLTATDSFVYLRYQNASARLYGLDISGYRVLTETSDFGKITSKANISYIDGKNRDTGDNLFNIMPLNAKFAVEQHISHWNNTVELELVSAKDSVNAERNEIKTAGYSLIHLRTRYELKQVSIDLGVINLFDRFYSSPLAGAYMGQGMTMSGTGIPWGVTVPGIGRSFYAGMTYRF